MLAMKRSIDALGATLAAPRAKPRTALFEPPKRPPRHSKATVAAASSAFVAYLALEEVEVEIDEDGREVVGSEVEVPHTPPLPFGVARALLVVAETAEPNNSERARGFARKFAAIAFGRFDDEVHDQDDDEVHDQDDDEVHDQNDEEEEEAGP
jgi:hypothetical protein